MDWRRDLLAGRKEVERQQEQGDSEDNRDQAIEQQRQHPSMVSCRTDIRADQVAEPTEYLGKTL